MKRRVVLGIAAGVACLLVAGPAMASTEIKIREVSPGKTDYTDNPEFVELQLIANGQGGVAGKTLRFYGPSGAGAGTIRL